MKIIEIQALPNGAHRNQTTTSTTIPTGWSDIPGDVAIPEKLAAFMKGKKQSVEIGKDFEGFKKFLMEVGG